MRPQFPYEPHPQSNYHTTQLPKPPTPDKSAVLCHIPPKHNKANTATLILKTRTIATVEKIRASSDPPPPIKINIHKPFSPPCLRVKPSTKNYTSTDPYPKPTVTLQKNPPRLYVPTQDLTPRHTSRNTSPYDNNIKSLRYHINLCFHTTRRMSHTPIANLLRTEHTWDPFSV